MGGNNVNAQTPFQAEPPIVSGSEKKSMATLFFRNGYVLGLTMVILLVGGLSSLINLPRLEDPRITNRNATILTFLPGASASRIEALVNEPIEEALEEIDAIKKIESTARSGVSNIRVELQDHITDKTNEDAFSKIRSRLQNIQGGLPAGTSLPFLDDQRGAIAYSLIIGLGWQPSASDHNDVSSIEALPLNMLQRVALDLKDRMLNTPNTELVRIFGGAEEEIRVTPNANEMAALGLSPAQLAEIIRSSDSKVSAGQMRGQSHDVRLEVVGALDGVSRIRAIPIRADERGSLLTLGDIADVSRGIKTPSEQIGFSAGQRMLFIAIRADENVRLDRWNAQALSVLSDFRQEYDPHFTLDVLFEQNTYTEERLGGLVLNLLAGALVVVFIVFLTMGWKSGLIVGAALPLSAAGAVFSLNFFGQGIHQMSIFGMIIAIGLLIDSAIVMTDEVRKQIHAGVSRLQAMENSVKHLFVPLLASTFTTILGFMPIFLLPGNAGDFVSPIAISVVMALCFAFVLSVTVIPALAARSSHPHQPHKTYAWWRVGLPKPHFVEDIKAFVLHALQRPKRFALVAVVPAVLGFGLMSTMPMEFFPAGDRDMFEVKVWLPSDSAISQTEQVVQRADRVLNQLDGIETTHWLMGASIPSVYYNQIPTQDKNSAYAQAVVIAESPRQAERLILQAQSALNEAVPEARVVVKAFAQGPPVAAPIEFRISGPDLATLRLLGEAVKAVMHQQSSITHTRSSIEGGEAKLWFDVDEAQAHRLGLSLRSVAEQYEGNLEGFFGGSVLEDVEELPIRVRLPEGQGSEMAYINNLALVTPNGQEWIPSAILGDMKLRPEISAITRFNGERVNTIFGYLTPDAKAVSVAAEILQRIQASMDLPTGYAISVAGDSEQQAEAVGNLMTYAPVLLVMMAATLILAFRSVAMALIIGSVGLLSVGLGMLALKIAGYPLGFNPLIGSIGLAGVAINDTIVVLAAIRSNPRARLGDAQAIVQETFGCGRHVLSTTFTTIGGFIPLLLFSGGAFWPPLSVVIAGGIGFALILAMFFTPLAYQIYANRQVRLRVSEAKTAEVPVALGSEKTYSSANI